MSLLLSLRDRTVHLVGISSLEIADVACFLGRRGMGRLVAHDLCDQESLFDNFRAAHIGMDRESRQAHWEDLRALDLPLRAGDDYLAGVEPGDVVVVSQAWRLYDRNAPLEALRRDGAVRLVTPVEIYLQMARERAVRTLGVTGSNGKSTTTTMIAAILGAAEWPHVVAGNYRYRGPIMEALDGLDPAGLLVLELSNHHLMAVEQGVDVGVVTNVTPNHLEEHDGFEGYVATKRRLAELQDESGVLVLNDDDPVSREFGAVARGAVRRFSVRRSDVDAHLADRALWLADERGGTRLIGEDELPVPGSHNVQNALAAALATRAAGVSARAISAGLRGFEGAPGRLELIRTVGGVRFVWDVESTTPESTVRGLQAFETGTVHLIAGGENKALSYGGLIDEVRDRRARLYLLDGSATDLMRRACRDRGWSWEDPGTLEEAVGLAYARAREGDVVLVSPGAKAFYNRHVRGGPSYVRLVKRLRAADRGRALAAPEEQR